MARTGLLKGTNAHEFCERPQKERWVQCRHCGLMWPRGSYHPPPLECWAEQRRRKQAIIDGKHVTPIEVRETLERRGT